MEDLLIGYPLSPQQERVWSLLQGSARQHYRVQRAVHLEGPLDPERLQTAVAATVHRHEILRSTFRRLPTMSLPVQVVEESSAVEIQRFDANGREAQEQERWLDEIFRSALAAPFDLEKGPALRLALVRLAPDWHILLASSSALHLDEAGLRNLIHEIGLHYAGGGRSSVLEEPVQYADFASWQNELLEANDSEGAEYWRARRITDPRGSSLPFEKRLPELRAFEPQSLSIALDGRTVALKARAREHEASVEGFLLAVWQTLLFRLSGSSDLVVGTAFDGRNYEGLREALGLFARYLPVQTWPEPALRFTQLLRRTQVALAEIREWQEYFSWARAGQANSGETLWCSFGFELEEEWGGEKLDGIALRSGRRWALLDRYKVKLFCLASGDRLQAELQYDANLYAEDDVARLAERFETLLDVALADPSATLAELEIMGPSERAWLLSKLNATDAPIPQSCLHELVFAQAERAPDATALLWERGQMTYAELVLRVRRLAHRLRSLGVDREARVALCLERSPEMVVGILGILAAGGAYVPLEPTYPPGRLGWILADATPVVFLGNRDRIKALAPEGMRTLAFEEDLSGEPAEMLDGGLGPDGLAYVLYTSGSTGRPKGVMVTHRAIANRLLWMVRHLPIGGSDTVAFKTPFSFDASIWELFLPLFSGAKVFLARPDGHRDAAYLAGLIAEHGVTILQLVPSMLRVFLDEPGLAACGGLRRLFCGGEALPADLRDRLFSRLDAELHNLYGPTECSIDATHWICLREGAANMGPIVPIGRPIDNLRVYVLDSRLQLVPAGVAGELCVGGLGLARGYQARSDLTAERFVPDPFEGQPGGRLYRTGDLVRHLPDGALAFLGRLDGQVKIRGFRIETAEIETVLGEHPDVLEVAVVARESEPGDFRLVSYLVAKPGRELETALLRGFLAQRLPEHMLPSAYVVLKAMPVLPSGKLDRRALPAPESERACDAELVAARSEVEAMLAGMWAESLHLDRVGANDNFFDLGGHSLLATQMIAHVREVFQVEMPLRSLFEHPTPASFSQRVEAAMIAATGLELPPIEPVPRYGDLPLSFSQQRLLFLERLIAGIPLYHLPMGAWIEGELAIPLLERCFTEIVRRHESLRTTFRPTEGGGVQVIAPPRPVDLPLVDLSGLDEASRRAVVRRLALEEARRIFDLERGPLMRITVLHLAAREHVVLITQHHIITDGWSTGVLVRELAALMEAFGKGEPSPLPELRIQYADFAAWQRQWLKGEVLDRQLDFWMRHLGGAPGLLELPVDRPRSAERSWRGAVVPIQLSRQVAYRLQALSRQRRSTLFMALFAAFDALLHRSTGQGQIVVGTPIANRTRGDLEPLIGLFMNTLALRVAVGGDSTFDQLLDEVREVALDAYAHQDLPFDMVVEHLKPERNLSHAPLFQVLFALQNAPVGTLKLPGVKLGFLVSDAGSAKFDWTLSLTENESGLVGSFEYAADLFDAPTILRTVRHFEGLVVRLLENPGQRLSELPLLSDAELHQISLEWNDITAPIGWSGGVPRMFEEQARRTPEVPAVIFAGEALSYRELDRRANALARRLRSAGVGPGERVGLHAERSLELVVGILAIFKAGGTFVPLDPAYPVERLTWFLEDSAAAVLLAGEGSTSLSPVRIRKVPLVSDEPVAPDGSRPGWQVAPDDLAYLIYTSGTTGRPKAVAVDHGNLASLLAAGIRTFGFAPGERMPCLAPFSFDIFLFELLSPLLTGGTSVLLGLRPTLDLDCLVAELETASWLHAVPALMRQVVKSVQFRGRVAVGLRGVFVGGDTVPADLLADLREVFPGAQVRVLYGPTETTILATSHALPAVGIARSRIGRPLANMELSLRDVYGNAVPVGVPGEIWIGGTGVSRGYLNRPDLTAERFVPAAGGRRVYRTGDLARWLPDGSLEFLGRIDRQVKIRGFRIELAEIEAVLRQHPAVREVAVIARAEPAGIRLVAYVEGPQEISGLRDWLHRTLPDYMVPGELIALDRLPLTAHGKVDVRALPAPDRPSAEGDRSAEAPRTVVEELVAGLWAEVLGQEKVGPRDSFWEMGGHSLLATQVISRVRRLFGVDLPLRILFDHPTLEGFARQVEAVLQSVRGVEVPPLEVVPREGDLPLSFPQQRLLFLEELTPGTPLYNIAVTFHIQGPLALPVLERTFNELVRRHESLRTTFRTTGQGAVQIIHPAGRVAMPEIDLSRLSASERDTESRRLAKEEAGRVLDLVRGPLLRVTVLRLGEGGHRVLLTIHHIIADGWSIEVLLREASLLVAFFSRREASPLPPLRVQYADFATWQRSWLQGEALERELAYWRQQLGSAPEPLALPTDRPRPALRGWRGALVPLRFPEDLSARLEGLGRRAGTTVFMTLLTAFQVLLHRYTGQESIVVGTPVANRSWPELEPLVGFFANTLALCTDLAGDPSGEELLGRVREVALGAYAHQDLPFEMVVDNLQPERDLSRTPVFQVALAFQNRSVETMEISGLRVSLVPVETAVAKFDWTLALRESAEGLSGSLEYATDLFDRTTIVRAAGHLEMLLAGLTEDARRSVWELPLLTRAEQHQLGARSASVPVPAVLAPLHERFEAVVDRSPDAVAVCFEGRSLTYRELDERANRLAHRLRRWGVGPETRVALCLERSHEIVVGILGILKVGGAYVPVDPSYPKERLDFVLEDTAAPVLLTQSSLLDRLGEAKALVLSLDTGDMSEESHERPGIPLTIDQAAYVIYTSGSTGRPKGVVVTHANAGRLFAATDPWFGFGTDDTWTLFHSYAFDFSVWEIWGALFYGGRLVVVPYLVSRSPEAFHELLHTERVTVLNQTPSAFRQLIRADAEMSRELSLRWVIFGGEGLDPKSLAPWFSRHGDRRPQLINMYGITETTVHVTYRPVRAVDLEAPGSLIGVPIADLEIHVLDRRRRPAPLGIPGELYIGGSGLARGYLGRPELTAERFLPDPFSSRPGDRLYRSGDLARRLADGDLEYLGRIDNQVKVRGFRIELGEIEAALSSGPAVSEAVVVARRDEKEEIRLVAYVVPSPGEVPSIGALRSFLQQKLPDHAVPAAFVVLDRLPLTAHGKLDRQSLPAPDTARPELDAGYVAPRTGTERALTEIWGEVLELDRVGIHDNFFALGGDSIRSVRIIAMARERGLNLSLQQLFQHSTIAELAPEIAAAAGAPREAVCTRPFHGLAPEDLARIPAGVEDAYPLTRLQAGMLYHMYLMPDAPVYHNVNSFFLESPFDLEKLQIAVDRAVARHAVLRTSFDMTTFSEPLQLVRAEAALPVGFSDIRYLPHDEQERVVDAYIEAQKAERFDFGQAPQLRFFVHLRRLDAFQFTLTENHAILDGWSLHATLHEIFADLGALFRGETRSARRPPAIPYREFVWLEREALASRDAEEYWDRQLSGISALTLPRWPPGAQDHSRPRVGVLTPPVSPRLSQALWDLATDLGVPLKSVLLTAHLKVLSLIGGQPDVVSGMTSHGRPEDAEGAETRGLFLNTLPVRITLRTGTWADLVRQVFATEQEMLPFRRYPLAEMQRKRGQQPLFEAGFNFVHFHVVEGILKSGQVQVLGFKKSEETSTPLAVGFHVSPLTRHIGLEIDYDTSRIPAAQGMAIAGYYGRVLRAMADDPLGRHDAADLRSETERQLLLEWNATGPATGGETTLTGMLVAQAAKTPDAVAAVYGESRLTYREIDELSSRLAHRLRSLGVGSESLVGLCVGRSLDLVVGIMGILKAGAAYVPLDPAYPVERLAWMVEDSGIEVVVGQERTARTLPALGPASLRWVLLDTGDEWLSRPGPDIEELPEPDGVAYAIFTSGSTGRPKSVLVSQRNAVHSTAARFHYYPEPVESFVLLSSFAFDSSVAGIFWSLCQGGTLLVPEEELQWDLEKLTRFISGHCASHMLLLPSLYALLLERAEPAQLASLRAVIVAGEACPADLVERHARLLPQTRLYNEYGPTEASVWCTVAALAGPGSEPAGTLRVPIGHPIPGARIHLLGPDGLPTPIGTPGELYVGGAGIARGYLNRPDLTAERFLPDPFGEPGGRLYRTGDLARYRPDGAIDYLGRIDHQVKIRGFRIELGEIETALAQHPAVHRSAVIVREDAPGDRRLTAYMVFRDGEPADTVRELRELLQQNLPAHMIPAAFVPLESLPLNANGKLDRDALPAPGAGRGKLGGEYVAPRSAVERAIAEVWRETLQVDDIGVHDNFFDLGGHSLLIVRMHRKLEEALGCEVPVLEIFRFPTISSLARFLSEPRQESAFPDRDEVRAKTRRASVDRRKQIRDKRRAVRE